MQILNILSFYVSIIGIVVIVWGVLIVVIEFLRSEYIFLRKNHKQNNDKKNVRCRLGSYILLGLEFMIAGDIMHTVLNPSKDSLIVLGSIVAIRTVISYFLNKELKADS
ncbi:MAG: hypothetical protein K1060chlam1_00306 [Candidatus Anoxychlamydiales bacterium]|nr:hypothetical protein [Candidatus Anoxychlamydiales bacterium]